MGPLLVLNAGSSSLKAGLFDATARRRVVIERIGTKEARLVTEDRDELVVARDGSEALDIVLRALDLDVDDAAAVGHRIVHGGAHHDRACRLTAEVLRDLASLQPLDPDHLPAELALVRLITERAPSLTQVGSFDTAFHRTMPRVATLLALPYRFEEQGVRRYGFHGLSYTFLVAELARRAGGAAASGRLVLAHLGSGASLAAVHQRRCVDTTMGFTPNSGVAMGTRSGDLEPGVMVHLLRSQQLTVGALDALLSHASGLLGLAGENADMRDLLARRAEDPRADDAVSVFCHHIKKAIGALVTTLNGIDTLVFTGGIGEHASSVRAEILAGLGHLGIAVDERANEQNAAVISRPESRCVVHVIRTDEESVIASETRAILEHRGEQAPP